MPHGDWGYVVAGYGLSMALLAAYLLRLRTRARKAVRLIDSLRRRPG